MAAKKHTVTLHLKEEKKGSVVYTDPTGVWFGSAYINKLGLVQCGATPGAWPATLTVSFECGGAEEEK